jgi:hypothetical protein
VQQFRSVEGFAMAVPFEHRDRNGFNPFVSGEAEVTVQAFAPPPHAAPRIRSTRFQYATIGVLAGRALHARELQLFINLRQACTD